MSITSSGRLSLDRNSVRLVYTIIGCSVAIGLIIWHTVLWHNNGKHDAMIAWTGSAKTYLAVLYNLALMLITGALLGTLMGKITELIGHFINNK